MNETTTQSDADIEEVAAEAEAPDTDTLEAPPPPEARSYDFRLAFPERLRGRRPILGAIALGAAIVLSPPLDELGEKAAGVRDKVGDVYYDANDEPPFLDGDGSIDYSITHRRNIKAFIRYFKGLKEKHGVIGPEQEAKLKKWAIGYVKTLNLQDGGLYVETLVGQMISILANYSHDENKAERTLDALLRSYDATHWNLTGFDVDEFERPGELKDSDVSLVTQLMADTLLKIRDFTKEKDGSDEEKFESYSSILQAFEEALTKLGYGMSAGTLKELADHYNLGEISLGVENAEPLFRNVEWAERYLSTGSMIKDASEEGFIWDLLGLDGKLVGIATSNSDFREYFEHLFEYSPEEAETRFRHLAEKYKLPIDTAKRIEEVLKSDASIISKGFEIKEIIKEQLTDAVLDSNVKNAGLLRLTPEKMAKMVRHYNANVDAIRLKLNAENLAKTLWETDAEDVHDGVDAWLWANLSEELREPYAYEDYSWLDEGALGTTLLWSPMVGVPIQAGKTWVDLKQAGQFVEEGKGMLDEDVFYYSIVPTSVEEKLPYARQGLLSLNEFGNVLTAANAVGPQWSPISIGPIKSYGAFTLAWAGKIIYVDCWLEPEIDPRTGEMTTRSERGEAFIDETQDKVKFALGLLLGLWGVAGGRLKKKRAEKEAEKNKLKAAAKQKGELYIGPKTLLAAKGGAIALDAGMNLAGWGWNKALDLKDRSLNRIDELKDWIATKPWEKSVEEAPEVDAADPALEEAMRPAEGSVEAGEVSEAAQTPEIE